MEALSNNCWTLAKRRHVPPEFLNRFDTVVAYRPLTADELVSVARAGTHQYTDGERHITVVMMGAQQKLARLGFDRHLARR